MTNRKGALYLLGALVVWFAVAVLLLVGRLGGELLRAAKARWLDTLETAMTQALAAVTSDNAVA